MIPSTPKSSRAGRRKAGAGGLDEEITRIQTLLRRLDDSLAKENEVSLKDLEQAVHTAGDGGRSIAQLRKLAKELEAAVQDADYERIRASLFATLEKLGQWKGGEAE